MASPKPVEREGEVATITSYEESRRKDSSINEQVLDLLFIFYFFCLIIFSTSIGDEPASDCQGGELSGHLF